MDEILDSLRKEDIAIRLSAVSELGSVPADSRPELFNVVADDLNREVREAAARLITLCPIAFERYLFDVDPRVQAAVVANSVEVRGVHPDPALVLARLTDEQFIQSASTDVRCHIARVLSAHAKLEPPDAALAVTVERVVPVIDLFMNEVSDDLRTATARTMNSLAKYFGTDFVFEHLHTSFHRMITDVQWRVRICAVDILFGVAIVGNASFFNNHLMTFFVRFLKDPCDRVRHFVLSGLPNLVARFGVEWLTAKLIAVLQELARAANFLYREAYLLAISSLVTYFPEQYRSNYVYQPMIRMLRDPVENVVAVALILLSEHIAEIHPFRKQYELRPLLEGLVAHAPPTTKNLARAFMNQFQ
jgi:hypothetical protein